MTREEAKAALIAAGMENAAGEARMLSEHFGGNIPPDVVRKRTEHYPLQYLLGTWGFWREEYEVSSVCLCPRADTEHLVECAVNRLPHGARFLDLCTGSGCVAISVLATRKDTQAVAVDLFPETLELARRNAVRNGVAERVRFLCADVFAPLPQELATERFDAILSNPPYLTGKEMTELQPEVRFEPAAALNGGSDGLDFYREILNKWQYVLRKGGFFAFEIGSTQASALRALAAEHGRSCRVIRDYAGNDRVVLLEELSPDCDA